jgi:GTP1/Obg family GTP-binding protein
MIFKDPSNIVIRNCLLYQDIILMHLVKDIIAQMPFIDLLKFFYGELIDQFLVIKTSDLFTVGSDGVSGL